ncbi:c-type cytochrome [Jannaschia rubra]|nr:c-type cytochrome [Jannaschia rubra]
MSLGSGPVAAQDMTGAEDLYRDTCRNCHGPKAKGMASFPKLAGLEEDFLAMRLTQYRAGEKVGPNSALMQPNAIDLSDEEIADLARYISTSFD